MNRSEKVQYLFFGFLLLAILPYLYLSFFTQPIAEDFGFASYYFKNDFWSLLKKGYTKMNGRYISNVFMFLGPLSFKSFFWYKIAPLLQIIFLLFASNYLIGGIIKSTKIIVLNTTLVFTLLFLHNLPIISEGIYWYTGAVIYQLGITITILYFGLLIRVSKGERTTLFRSFSLCFLLFLACGFNEVLTILILVTQSFVVFLAYKKGGVNKSLIVQFLLTVLFSSIMFIAPGNVNRDAMYLNNHNLADSLIMSILQTGRFAFLWIFSLPLVASSLLRLNSKRNKQLFTINKWVSLFLLLLIIFICVFPPYWATGILGQHRTLNVAYLFFLMLWFVNLSAWKSSLLKNRNIGLFIKRGRSAWVILMLLGIIFTSNGYNTLEDIFSGKAGVFSEELSQRHIDLKHATTEHKKEIIFNPLSAKPKTLFVTDINTDPNFWTNLGYNEYFGLDNTAVYIKEPDTK